MSVLNIASYKFIPLDALMSLRASFQEKANDLQLKGTILLSGEGINLNLSGLPANANTFKQWLLTQEKFQDMSFRESYSQKIPFKKLKVAIKKEIITFRQPDIKPENQLAPAIEPETLKQWLDEKRDITLLDTRNDFEVSFGTFDHAVNLHIDEFTAFASAATMVEKKKPIVMFCTGGIRCEKASLYLLKQGYSEVYQLAGGILNYFAKVGSAHYHDECFVFDERVALDANLHETGTKQCESCGGPIKPTEKNCIHCLS